MCYDYRYQLAPLPAETYFKRHGRMWLLNKAKYLRPDDTACIVRLNDQPSEPIAIVNQTTDYLLLHIISDVVPLDRQFGRIPKLFAPNEIFKLLWQHLDIPANMFEQNYQDLPQPVFPPPISDENVDNLDKQIFVTPLPQLNCYMVVDASRNDSFPPTYPVIGSLVYSRESLLKKLKALLRI